MVTNPENLGNFGERQDAECKDWGYFAKLSIYRFASQFCTGKDFLEIGCGTGYGTAFLSNAGVRTLTAIDKDPVVIGVLEARHPAIRFRSVDLDLARLDFDDGSFDVIFSTNVFEHIAQIEPVLTDCHRMLRADGVAIIAVPPIISVGMLAGNACNLFHINNIPPWSWKAKLKRFFGSVEYLRHWVTPDQLDPAGALYRDRAAIDTFVFEPDEAYTPRTITSIFVCRDPLSTPIPYAGGEACPDDWHADKVSAEARQAAYIDLTKSFENNRNWWHDEIEKLHAWARQSIDAGMESSAVLDGVMRQLGFLNGNRE